MALLLTIFACAFPFFSFPLIVFYYHQYGKVKTSAFLSGLAASAIVFGYMCDQGNDIVRHMYNLRLYENRSFFEALDASSYRMLYIWDIWEWAIAHLANPYLLQASGAFFGYTLLAYIVFDSGKKLECDKRTINIAYVFALLGASPLSLAIGIRSGNALVFCAFAIYLYFMHRKSYLYTLVLLLLSIFLHHSMIIVVSFWMAYLVFQKKPIIGALIIIVILFTFTNYQKYISLFMGGGSMFESLGEDLQRSVIGYTGERLASFHYIVSVSLQALFVLLLFIRGGGIRAFTSKIELSDQWENIIVRVNQIQIILITAISCLLIILSYNGNRYFLICFSISFLPFLNTLKEYPFLRKNRFLYVDILLLLVLVLTVMLYGYDMNSGTGSYLTLLRSGIFGYLTRMLFN